MGHVPATPATSAIPDVYTTIDEPTEHDEHGEPRKTYSCKNCNKPYFSKKGVWQHMKKCKHSDTQTATQTSPSTETMSPGTMTAFMLEIMKYLL